MAHACRKWPTAAKHLHDMAAYRERWGAPWQLEQYTHGVKASSIVEGSFYAFECALHGFPRTYVGVVQCHMIKDGMKTYEEKQAAIRDKMIAFDEEISSSRTHAERECGKIFSHVVTDEFKSNNA